jgi:hypothetical protein
MVLSFFNGIWPLSVTEKRLETKNFFVRSLKYGISCMVYIVIKVLY